QLRRDHAARSAPGRPVIDDDRQRRLRDEPIEIGGRSDLDWRVGRADFVLALRAAYRLAETLECDPVLLSTRRARNDESTLVELNECHDLIVGPLVAVHAVVAAVTAVVALGSDPGSDPASDLGVRPGVRPG